jgi:hypothetical protein
MSDEAVQQLLDGFVVSIRSVLPVRALWVHGSLALGDFQQGRSDFDLVAVLEAPVSDPGPLTEIHRRLIRASPLTEKLHCTYVPVADLGDAAVRQPTFAQGRYFERPVTPVSWRELSLGDLSLFGPPPSTLLSATSDEELTAFIRRDLREFWYPVTAKRTPWLRDIWVDLSMVTLARAATTLRDGRLITKRAALDALPHLGAPLDVVQDIERRRYAEPGRLPVRQRVRRADQTRRFVRAGIDKVLS